MHVDGNYAYVVCNENELRIIDVSDPTSPTEVGHCSTPRHAEDVYVVGNYAYIACNENGLWIIDIRDPALPTEVGHCSTPYYAKEVYVIKNYAYIGDCEKGLRVIDVSNPTSPTEIGYYYNPEYPGGIYVIGNYAYIANRDNGLQIYEFYGGRAEEDIENIVEFKSSLIEGKALKLFIKCSAIINVIFYDVNGKIVKRERLLTKGGEVVMDVSELRGGVYLVKVELESKAKSKVFKVIKLR